MQKSCGAILYTYSREFHKLYFILGAEYTPETDSIDWYPFKGAPNVGETISQAAAREVREETVGIVDKDSIPPVIEFSTTSKTYFLGLVKVDTHFFIEFREKRQVATDPCQLEKLKVGYFTLEDICKKRFHPLTKKAVKMIAKHIPKDDQIYFTHNDFKYLHM